MGREMDIGMDGCLNEERAGGREGNGSVSLGMDNWLPPQRPCGSRIICTSCLFPPRAERGSRLRPQQAVLPLQAWEADHPLVPVLFVARYCSPTPRMPAPPFPMFKPHLQFKALLPGDSNLSFHLSVP